MPFRFTGRNGIDIHVAKNAVVFDGDTFTTDGYGEVVTSTLSPNTAFAAVPVRSAAGVWSVAMKDSAVSVLDVSVESIMVTSPVSVSNQSQVQLLAVSSVASGWNAGALVLNWVFHIAGVPTDLPANSKFRVFVCYSEALQG